MTTISRAAAALERSRSVATLSDRPSKRRMGEESSAPATVRATLEAVQVRAFARNGLDVVQVGGYASVTETGYEMFDMFGPYQEVVSHGAFGKTLASAPLVEFALNHGASGGASMAGTRNDTLTLSEDTTGLRYDAFVDPTRTDVADMLKALERGDLAEASFKFRIDAGRWSPDYTEYRIDAVNLERGDVSAVNFGANPHATSGIRSRAVTEARARLLQRALSDPERTDLAVLLGSLSAADDALDDALEGLSAMLGIPSVDECECDCAACAGCTGPTSADSGANGAAMMNGARTPSTVRTGRDLVTEADLA